MKHSIRKNDVKYVVNPEQKKVVAYIEGTKDMFIDFLEENYPYHSYLIWEDPLREKLLMPARFVGISTCGPSDEWNENLGKLIAFDRMKDNLSKSFFKRANTLVAEMERRLDIFCDRTNAYGTKLEVNTEHRKQLIEKLLENPENEMKMPEN